MIVAGTLLKTVCGFVFDNPLGKMMSAGALLLGSFMLWLWTHDANVAAAAQDKLATEITSHTEKLTNEGLKAREGAYQPGAWDRLRKSHCRDC